MSDHITPSPVQQWLARHGYTVRNLACIIRSELGSMEDARRYAEALLSGEKHPRNCAFDPLWKYAGDEPDLQDRQEGWMHGRCEQQNANLVRRGYGKRLPGGEYVFTLAELANAALDDICRQQAARAAEVGR